MTDLTADAKRALLKEMLRSRAGSAPAAPLPPAVLPAWHTFDAHPGYRDLKARQQQLADRGIDNPYFAVGDGIAADTLVVDGAPHVNFSSYNYLDLAGDARVLDAAREAIDRWGTSASASRMAAGEREIHGRLERRLAEAIGVDDALTFVGGHATNVAVLGHLFGPGDLIVYDALIHNSVMVGAFASGARTLVFPHNDVAALDALLRQTRGRHGRVVVCVEGVYSMDGDIAPLEALVELKARHDVLLFVDEAHSLGVLGRRGRGLAEHWDVDPRRVDIWMGTLSKALASCGGYVAGSAALIEYLRYTTPGFIFTCGMPPATAAASLAALEVLESEPERVRRLADNGELLLLLARARGLDTGASRGSAVVPVILGDSWRCLRVSQALRERHRINVLPIIAPAVDDASARLRFFVSAAHDHAQIRRAVDAVAAEVAAC